MEIETSIEKSRQQKLVDDDKFDRHMKRARIQDIESREKMMCHHSDRSEQVEQSRMALTQSVY